MSLFIDREHRRMTVLYVTLAFVLCGGALVWGCYDANSPHLPPCPDGGSGYTDPLGCFAQRVTDGGPDAR